MSAAENRGDLSFANVFMRQSGSASFTDFCAQVAPDLLPASCESDASQLAPHGTTVVAIPFAGGVLMAGDRRATWSNMIAQRDIEKVFAADEMSIIGVAGSAGLAINLARQFQVELEHYAKIEGTALSLAGKVNRLATMLAGNLGLAFKGLATVPLFAGWDESANRGRIFSFDVTGGRYEEFGVAAIGSGSVFAKGTLKKLFRQDFDETGAALAAIQSLFDAADEDSATGGPDVARNIYPVIISATKNGVRKFEVAEVAELTNKVLASRLASPEGPKAELL